MMILPLTMIIRIFGINVKKNIYILFRLTFEKNSDKIIKKENLYGASKKRQIIDS